MALKQERGILSAGTGSILAEILKIIHSQAQFENYILFPNGMVLIGKMKDVSHAQCGSFESSKNERLVYIRKEQRKII